MVRRTIPALCVLMFAMNGASAAASSGMASSIGSFKQWGAWTYEDGGRPRCFVSSAPGSAEPSQLDHGEVMFFLKAGRDSEPRTESSFQTGYPFAEGSNVEITIDDEKFVMITSGRNAWLRRVEREPELLAAMKAGSTMAVEATSARGNGTSYVFSLDGVTAATARILSRCR
ncbi:MAG: hypothetical protein K0R27_3124 [Xanthobacteraceae bacterium]|jgi:hypothetical protein|nr:hypothetical protein [Xanthobacteraceae bacterium]